MRVRIPLAEIEEKDRLSLHWWGGRRTRSAEEYAGHTVDWEEKER
jgi:hypothetical protein